jgi:UDP-N-acetylglucosamine 2-epimerase (non-hydrolysing)
VKRRRVAVVIGTRPEAIKLAPVVHELVSRRGPLAPLVVLTAQHRELTDDVLRVFRIRADHDLDVMRPDQGLFQTTAAILTGLGDVFARVRPAAVLVQGDTTTVVAGALAAFYRRIPLGHVEAGLRTYDRGNPWPEEMNRRVVSTLADFHFAPTTRARDALIRENVPRRAIHVTGNTVVDALKTILADGEDSLPASLHGIDLEGKELVLVTAHRRESWGPTLDGIARALRDIVDRRPRSVVVFPVHPNPHVSKAVRPVLGRHPRVHLVPPMDYPSFIGLMARSTLIITDSGGIQEEAPTLRVPVLVVRKTSERPEGARAGAVKIVGTDPGRLTREALSLLASPARRAKMVVGRNPYCDGRAARRIVDILEKEIGR